jgi:Fe-S cluster assembly protein SufD
MQAVTLSLADARHPLYERLSELGIPGNKTEQYKNFAIKPLLAKEYAFKEAKQVEPKEGSRVVIENGVVVESPKNVKISFEEDFKADEEHYDALYFMSHVLSKSVIRLEIDADAVVEIEHRISEKERLFAYRLCVTTPPNGRVEIMETFDIKESQNALLLYGVDAEVARDATLRWVRHENAEIDNAVVIGSHRYNVAKQGAIELKTFDFGSGLALHLYKIDLDNYAWTDAQHLLLATKEARRGNVVHINHNQPYAKSVHEARAILKDKATGIFDGKIMVGHEAKYSNAKQNSKAILLGEHAHMYAKPQLEIYTDELEASHGSTIGQLEEETLFYLSSRGVALDDAKKMLVLAFANTLIETLGEGEAFDKIHADFEAAYYV